MAENQKHSVNQNQQNKNQDHSVNENQNSSGVADESPRPALDDVLDLSGNAELDDLLNAPVEQNDCRIRPTNAAFRAACELIRSITASAPAPEFISDGDQGIDVEWNVGEGQVAVWCKPDGAISICIRYERGGRYELYNGSVNEALDRLAHNAPERETEITRQGQVALTQSHGECDAST